MRCMRRGTDPSSLTIPIGSNVSSCVVRRHDTRDSWRMSRSGLRARLWSGRWWVRIPPFAPRSVWALLPRKTGALSRAVHTTSVSARSVRDRVPGAASSVFLQVGSSILPSVMCRVAHRESSRPGPETTIRRKASPGSVAEDTLDRRPREASTSCAASRVRRRPRVHDAANAKARRSTQFVGRAPTSYPTPSARVPSSCPHRAPAPTRARSS